MRSALGEQYARFVALNDRHQHRGQSDGPHPGNGGDHCGIGVLLVMPRDHIRIDPTGTSNVSLSCAREKNSDAVRKRSLCKAMSAIAARALHCGELWCTRE